MIHLVPVEGARVRDPKSNKLLDKNGIKLETLDTFYTRRIKDGSMIEVAAEEKAPQESKKEGKHK